VLTLVESAELVTPATVWSAWSFESTVLVPLAVVGIAYGRAVVGARREGGRRAIRPSMVACFAAGWLALAAALVSPVDRLGETLFAAHMVQHLLLILVAAPLLVVGAPPSIWLWMFRARRRRVIGAWLARSRGFRAIERTVANPGFVMVAHVAALWFWHFPRPYRAALEHPALHAAEHLSFVGTAMLFWWMVLKPMGRRSLGFGPSILAVGVVLCAGGALGALLMFSSPWYSVHAAGEAAWGITALEDQQLAGLLMWIPAGAVYVGAAAALFAKWMASDERRAHQADRRLAFDTGGSR
jgi:cytochrome c oxidase assembly factor CtaG